MPFINSKVTVTLNEKDKEILKTKLGQAIQLIPGKSESWLMVGFEDQYSLYFKGKNDAPMAFIDVSIFGSASPESYEALTAKLCDIYEEVLNISKDNIYVKYQEVEHWGWNGGNF